MMRNNHSHNELPATGGRIEPLQIKDLDTVVDMHCQTFKGKLSGELSKACFRAFFRDLVGPTYGVCYGWKRNAELVGAVCGRDTRILDPAGQAQTRQAYDHHCNQKAGQVHRKERGSSVLRPEEEC